MIGMRPFFAVVAASCAVSPQMCVTRMGTLFEMLQTFAIWKLWEFSAPMMPSRSVLVEVMDEEVFFMKVKFVRSTDDGANDLLQSRCGTKVTK